MFSEEILVTGSIAAALIAGLGLPASADQGLTLIYGFSHEEAADSFRAAATEDPECAMCSWGVALARGPNINACMDPANHPEIRAALDRAIASVPKTTANEQAYVGALADRYGAEALEDRSQKLDGVVIWGLNAPENILAVATEVLAGEIASARGDHDSAVAYLRRAVELETAVVYDEPPTWNVPVRQILGAVLLAADLPSEAELGTELAKAWKEADVEIDASRF